MQDKGLDWQKSENKQGHLLTSPIVFRLKDQQGMPLIKVG